MRRLTKNILLLALVMALLGALALPAQAYTLDFLVPSSNPGASISYAGGSNPLIGTNLAITEVSGLDTPLHNGETLTISGGFLNFTTGDLVYYTAPPPSYMPKTWIFDGNSSLAAVTITGEISSLGIVAGSTLMSGSFTGSSVVNQGATAGPSFFYVTGSSFTDTKNSLLLAYFGLPDVTCSGNFNIGFYAANATPPAGFSSTIVTSGDVINNLVPAPSTILLLGTGLMGLVGLRYRRRKANARI